MGLQGHDWAAELNWTEDNSPVENLSGSSDELLHRGDGVPVEGAGVEISVTCDFGEEGAFSQPHILAEACC